MLNDHAIQQLNDRFNFLPVEKRALIGLNALRVATVMPDKDIAVKLWKIKGAKCKHDHSNGNQVWAIIRQGVVKTFMLRRRTQSNDIKDFNVDLVTNIGDFQW